MMNQEQKLRRLVASLQLLAAEADVQLSVFPTFVCKPDEIVLTFDECSVFSQELVDAELLSVRAEVQLQRVDECIASLGDEDSIWSESAVREDPQWAELRQVARTALKEMGEIQQAPELGWMAFVPGSRRTEESG